MKGPKIEKHAVLKESAVRAKVVNRIMGEMCLKRVKGERAKWQRELGDHLIDLQGVGDGTWWLVVACSKENPGMEFSGNLGQCFMQYTGVVLAITAGAFGGKK